MSKELSILVISDVDGCITNGQFIYTADGKVGKIFGCGDHEGVKLLRKNNIDVEFITADRVGFPITEKRVSEMHCKVTIMSEVDRYAYIENKCKDYDVVVFFGDGIGDASVIQKLNSDCIYFIVPQNGREEAKEVSDYVTPHCGAQGAFLDLSIHVAKKFRQNNYVSLYDDK